MAQVVHCAGETGPAEPGTYAVVLAAESERKLSRLADRLEALEVPVHRVVESHGRHAGQLMALGLPPGPKSERGRHLSSLPLVRFEALSRYRWMLRANAAERERLSQSIVELERELAEAQRPWWRRWFDKFSTGGREASTR